MREATVVARRFRPTRSRKPRGRIAAEVRATVESFMGSISEPREHRRGDLLRARERIDAVRWIVDRDHHVEIRADEDVERVRVERKSPRVDDGRPPRTRCRRRRSRGSRRRTSPPRIRRSRGCCRCTGSTGPRRSRSSSSAPRVAGDELRLALARRRVRVHLRPGAERRAERGAHLRGVDERAGRVRLARPTGRAGSRCPALRGGR